MKEDAMGRHVALMWEGGRGIHTGFWQENQKEKDY
jgi:hypothetical protein